MTCTIYILAPNDVRYEEQKEAEIENAKAIIEEYEMKNDDCKESVE